MDSRESQCPLYQCINWGCRAEEDGAGGLSSVGWVQFGNASHANIVGKTYRSPLNFAGLSPNRTQSGRNPIGQQHVSG